MAQNNDHSRGKRRRPYSGKSQRSSNHGQRPRTVTVEMGKYFDGEEDTPIVRVIKDNEKRGYLTEFMKEFGFDISEGQRFKITAEPL